MRYYIIAGEASGDLHGSNLLKALKVEDPKAEFQVWGGDLMENAGGNLRKHYRDLAFMGFVEVVKNIRTIFKNIDFCKKDIEAYQPDVLILIDYPGFNLRIAKWAKEKNIKVFYYISPQIWAWHTSRVHKIKRVVDRMFVILPFEKSFYKKYDFKVDYVGHPLLDVVDEVNSEKLTFKKPLNNKPVIALLPGSRKQEIKLMLKEMVKSISSFPEYEFVIAGAPSLEESFYTDLLKSFDLQLGKDVNFVTNQTYQLLKIAKAALVTSGTATLETALFEVPQIVCYKGNILSYWLARRLIQVSYISLVNLIMDKVVVRELIQHDFNNENLVSELKEILSGSKREDILKEYLALKAKLGGSGASGKVASLMVGYLRG